MVRPLTLRLRITIRSHCKPVVGNSHVETPILWVALQQRLGQTRLPLPSALLHSKFTACCQHGKHQSSDMAAAGYVPPRDFITRNLLKYLPQQLPKIPPVRNAIMRRSGCFVTHAVSLKRIFFLFKQIFSRRFQRFSKATAKTEQLIILLLQGLRLHRRFLYLKTLVMLTFTSLSCYTWPLDREKVGNT